MKYFERKHRFPSSWLWSALVSQTLTAGECFFMAHAVEYSDDAVTVTLFGLFLPLAYIYCSGKSVDELPGWDGVD